MSSSPSSSSTLAEKASTSSSTTTNVSQPWEHTGDIPPEVQGSLVWTSEEEAALVKKIDRGLLPFLCITTALHYYSKSVISQAALFGIRGDLRLDVGNRFSIGTSIFYLGYMVGSYPTTYLAQRFHVPRVLGLVVTASGVCLLLTSVCHNYQSLYAQRFLLGLFQGSNPVLALITGCWYKKREQPFRIGLWTSFLGWAGVVTPLINYSIGSIDGSLASWKYMYFVAGSIVVLWGLLVPWVLSPDPASATGCWLRLSPREREIAVNRLRENNTGLRDTQFEMKQVAELALDLKFWLLVCGWFLSQLVSAPVNYFGPTIISGLGYGRLASLLLSAPLGAVGGASIVAAGWLPLRVRDARCCVVAACELVSCLGALLVWLLPRSAAAGQLAGVYVLPAVGAASSLIISLQIANSAGYTKRGAASAGLFMAFCSGNFVGPLLFREQDAPNYVFGFVCVVISSGIAAALALVYRCLCVRHNTSRDKAGTTEGFHHAFDNKLTDLKNKEFRYTI